MKRISKTIQTSNRQQYMENPTQTYFNDKLDSVRLINSFKKGAFIRHVPDDYTHPGYVGYALIRSLNCQASCSYCYLQSYFKSPDIVIFNNITNYIDFLEKFIVEFKKKYGDGQKIIFYDGDFYDSFGYTNIVENINNINLIILLIEKFNNVFLEIRSKCLFGKNYDKYSNLIISNRVIYGITFSPQKIIDDYESGTSNLQIRIGFAKYIFGKGGKVGIKLDPIILSNGFELYSQMINELYLIFGNKVNRDVGLLRIKEILYKRLSKVGSDIINGLILDGGFYKYPINIRNEIYTKIKQIIKNDIFICMEK